MADDAVARTIEAGARALADARGDAEPTGGDRLLAEIVVNATAQSVDGAIERLVTTDDGESRLRFSELRTANVTRCKRWHPGFGEPGDEWTGADWSNAMCGEAGETANVVKKIRRVEVGAAPGPDDPPAIELRRMLADELADVVTYADLLAAHYGIDLAGAIIRKFNRVSERQGFPDRLPVDPEARVEGDERERCEGCGVLVDEGEYHTDIEGVVLCDASCWPELVANG